MKPVLVREVMTKQVETASPDSPFREVVARMHQLRVSCIVICDDQQRPIGLVSERDVVRIVDDQTGVRPLPKTAAAFLGRSPITVPARATTDLALKLQRQHGIRHLIVLDRDQRLAGLVTQTDLARSYAMGLERERNHLEKMVSQRTRELEELNSELQTMALVDGLLGIGNRRAMYEYLGRIHEQSLRHGHPYGVALADVDQFKAYNDVYGHPQADSILREVTRALERSLRASDALFRYGGEEFLAVLPGVDLDGARVAAERLRGAVETLSLPHTGADRGIVTLSVGVAVWDRQQTQHDWSQIVGYADSALYNAKESGRNRVSNSPRA